MPDISKIWSVDINKVGKLFNIPKVSIGKVPGGGSITPPYAAGQRGVFGGGLDVGWAPVNILDYITISTPGNAIDFGDLTVERYRLAACSSSTRGVFGGGYASANSNVLDYITISTPGDATDFGDLTVKRGNLAACSSSTRGVFGGGYIGGVSNVIDYITIATSGNAVDFGDLVTQRYYLAACSDGHGGLA